MFFSAASHESFIFSYSFLNLYPHNHYFSFFSFLAATEIIR